MFGKKRGIEEEYRKKIEANTQYLKSKYQEILDKMKVENNRDMVALKNEISDLKQQLRIQSLGIDKLIDHMSRYLFDKSNCNKEELLGYIKAQNNTILINLNQQKDEMRMIRDLLLKNQGNDVDINNARKIERTHEYHGGKPKILGNIKQDVREQLSGQEKTIRELLAKVRREKARFAQLNQSAAAQDMLRPRPKISTPIHHGKPKIPDNIEQDVVYMLRRGCTVRGTQSLIKLKYNRDIGHSTISRVRKRNNLPPLL